MNHADATHDSSTSISLIGRISRGNDQQAWAIFVGRYGPPILLWCKRWLPELEVARDITQELLATLPQRMRHFKYNPAQGRFRDWLQKVTKHACVDVIRRKHKELQILQVLASKPAQSDLQERLSKLFDQEVYDLACDNVKHRLGTNAQGKMMTWQAYQLTASPVFFHGDGLSNTQAASQMNVTVGFIIKAKSSVKKMLKQEVRRLEEQS